MWLIKTWTWIKDNLFLVGTAVGGLVTLIVSILMNRGSEQTDAVLQHNKESDELRRKKDEELIKRTEKFVSDMSAVKEQAKQAGEELSREQEEALNKRLDAFVEAETEIEKKAIAEDIQEVFPFMNMVDPSEFGEVE